MSREIYAQNTRVHVGRVNGLIEKAIVSLPSGMPEEGHLIEEARFQRAMAMTRTTCKTGMNSCYQSVLQRRLCSLQSL